MLSASTLEILDALRVESHEADPEGGTLWTCTERANQAHTHCGDSRQKRSARWISMRLVGGSVGGG